MTAAPTSLSQAKKILCVFAPLQIHSFWEKTIAGRPIGDLDLNTFSLFKKIVLWKSYGHYYRSNPRSLLYMAHLSKDVLTKVAPNARVDAVNYSPDNEDVTSFLNEWTSTTWSDVAEAKTRGHDYDGIVLAYPDSTGFGWGSIEKNIRSWRVPIWILSGRQRLFALDNQVRRKLHWRRFLEGTWVIEIGLLLFLIPSSIILSAWDAAAAIVRFAKKMATP